MFEIQCENHSRGDKAVWAIVDGQQFPRADYVSGTANVIEKLIYEDGRDEIKPLMFSNISITGLVIPTLMLSIFPMIASDDENASRKVSCGNKLGLIEINVVRVKT